jgi:hypothetical protein
LKVNPMSQWIELDLSDHTPAPLTSRSRPRFTTEALDDVEDIHKRNEEAVRLVTHKIELLREHARKVVETPADSSGTLSGTPTGTPSSGSDIPRAFRARLETQSRLMKSSGLRGSPAACVDRVVSGMDQAIEVLEALCKEFPLIVRKASGAAMTELKTSQASVAEQAQQAGIEVEKYTHSYRSRSDTQHGHELIAVSLEKVATVRDDMLKSRVFRELCEAAQYTMESLPSAQEDLLFAAGAILSHVENLKRGAVDPEMIEKEVQCIEMAFEEWRRELDRAAAGGGSGGGSGGGRGSDPRIPPSAIPPRSLMNQIEDESRRRELETMPASKAMQLLRHTRVAMSKVDPESGDYKKLHVIARILSIRAGEGSRDVGGMLNIPTSETLPSLVETWRLQRGLILNHLHRLKSASQIVTKIQTSIRGDLDSTLQRIKDAHSKTLQSLQQQAATHDRAVMDRYVSVLHKTFSTSVARIMARASSLAESVVAALEMFISTGLLMQSSDEGLGQEFQDTAEYVRARQELGSGKDSDSEYDSGELGDSHSHTPPTSQLLRKVYALTIDAFEAWVQHAMGVLSSNANGMHRARAAVQKQIQIRAALIS